MRKFFWLQSGQIKFNKNLKLYTICYLICFRYVKYCMKFVNMLLGHKIKPILVFDGRHLPAKAETEVKRRE